jgi:hypothetical protein
MGECLDGNRRFSPVKEIEGSNKEQRKLEEGDRGDHASKWIKALKE